MIKSKDELKARFKKGDIPTEADFINLIESGINLVDDHIRKNKDEPLRIKAEKDEEVLTFYKSLEDKLPTWKLGLKNAAGTSGLNIAAGSDNKSRLFINEATGKLEVNGAVDINGDVVINGSLKVTGEKLNLKDKGVITFGRNAVLGHTENDAGLHSTIPGVTMKLSSRMAAIMFYTSPAAELDSTAKPRLVITSVGNLCLGTGSIVPQATTGPVLQIGKDDPTVLADGELSNGQIILARAKKNAGNRVYRFGINDNHELSIGDFGQFGTMGARSYKECLTIESDSGRTSIKNGLEVKGLLTAPDGIKVARTFEFDAEGLFKKKTTFSSGVKVAGTVQWGDGQVSLGYPGLYSTLNGTKMQLATVNAAILFYNNKTNEEAGTGKASMMINASGNVGIGTENMLVSEGTILQVGDDSNENVTRNGQIVIVRRTSKNGNRAFRIGINPQHNLSIYDIGHTGDRTETECISFECNGGRTVIKKDLSITGHKENSFSAPSSYITYNGITNFINNKGTSSGGFNFYTADTNGNNKVIAHLNAEGSFSVRGTMGQSNSYKDSDMRIKSNIQTSNGVSDLALLNQLRVADYDNLSQANRIMHDKGVIAQEIEKLIPEAIDNFRNFVADIFAAPTSVAAAGEEVLFTMNAAHNLVDGDLLRLITPQSETESLVTVVDDKSFLVKGTEEQFKDVLVYGKQVDDFRRVNYNYLFTLNLSATQELSKKIDTLLAWKTSLEKDMILVD